MGYSNWSNINTFTTKSNSIPTTEEAILTASDKLASDFLGWSVAINQDGTRAVAGAYLSDPGGTSAAGAAYVFVKSGGVWSQEAKLIASDKAASDNFGKSVAIDANGDRIAVGAFLANTLGTTDAGAVYIYTRSGSTWTQETKLYASDRGSTDRFGSSVAFTDNADRVAIGAINVDRGAQLNIGAVYVFSRSGTTWTEEAKLTDSVISTATFIGASVDISSTGDRVIAGANGYDLTGATDAGAAYIFVRSGTTWTQEAILVASDRLASDDAGYSVSMNSAGDVVAVGVTLSDPGSVSGAGAVYIYTRSGTTWSQSAKLSASDKATTDRFGYGVSLSASGTLLVASAPQADVSSVGNAGAVYLFTNTGGSWSQTSKLSASDKVTSDLFGTFIALSSDGSTLISSSPNRDSGGLADAGAAYIFV